MDASIGHDSRLSAAAERQMRTWARMQEMAAHLGATATSDRVPERSVKYVTLSRESGTDATSVAALVAKILGWSDYSRTLRDEVAQWYQEPRLMLDSVDETRRNWVFDIFGSWMDRSMVTHEKFLAQVGHMIHVLARRGPAVFVGRGAQFLLPRSECMAVRLVAPEAYRVDRVQQRENLATRGEARRWVRKIDAGRRDYIRRFFHHDITDAHLHDLVINVEHVGTVGAADQIVFAIRRAEGTGSSKLSAIRNDLSQSS